MRRLDSSMQFELLLGTKKFIVEAHEPNEKVSLRMGRKTFEIRVQATEEPNEYLVFIDGVMKHVILEDETEVSIVIQVGGKQFVLERFQSSTSHRVGMESVAPLGEEGSLNSPIPGKIVSVEVQRNSTVKLGSPVVTIESMKMESVIRSDRVGRINEVLVKAGDAIERGQALVRFEKSV
jgi:biotin carboxyl carrier protein